VSLFTVDAAGRITSILDAPEHPMKLPAAGVGMFGPLLQGFAGSMLPAVQQLSR
jgi:hypothetical protein